MYPFQIALRAKLVECIGPVFGPILGLFFGQEILYNCHHQEIIYAWAQNAPKLELPGDVAFRIAGDTKINWLVLQVNTI